MEPLDNTNTETDYTDNRHVPAMPVDTGRGVDDQGDDDGKLMHDLDAPDVHENGSTPDELGAILPAQIVPPSGWSPSSYA